MFLRDHLELFCSLIWEKRIFFMKIAFSFINVTCKISRNDELLTTVQPAEFKQIEASGILKIELNKH